MNMVQVLPQKGGPNELLAYISASRLKTWQECRLKFYFRYVEQIESPMSPALFVGQIVHRVLQRWNLNRWRGLPTDLETMQALFAECWEKEQSEEINWGGSEEEHRAKAWRLLEHYLAATPIPCSERPDAVEVLVDRDLDAHGLPPLRGIIDLVRKGGVIVDFKTSSRTPDPVLTRQQHETQLGCYALLYREATGLPEEGFELHHLIKTKEPKLVITALEPMGANQIGRLLRVMESYVQGVQAEDYIPSPGPQCAWCDYLGECQAWQGGRF